MRLIVFVNLPDRTEAMPFDIIDDRPCRLVLKDVLLFASMFSGDHTQTNYCLSINGKKLDHGLELSQNGIKNGDHLDIIQTNESINLQEEDKIKIEGQQGSSISQEDPGNSKATSKTKSEKQPVPGKKIEFD